MDVERHCKRKRLIVGDGYVMKAAGVRKYEETRR